MVQPILKSINSLINISITFNITTKKIVNDYFRANRQLGSSDRFFIKEMYYCYLRNKQLINCIGENDISIDINSILLYLIKLDDSWSNRKKKIYYQLKSKFENENPLVFDNLIPKSMNLIKSKFGFGSYYSFKSLFENETIRFQEFIGTEKLLSILHSLSPISIISHNNSINLSKLKDKRFEESDMFGDHFYYKSNIDLTQSKLYSDGLIEIQDIGSRIICEIIKPKKHSKILDACSGAGGKSLTFAKITNNNSSIFSFDTNKRKLNQLKLRASRLGYKSIKTLKHLDPNSPKFDYVLVDAPCTGSGTVRRFPEKKYNIDQHIIDSFYLQQLDILSFYANFVTDDGYLFYSTCSIFEKENELVSTKFLNDNPNFEPLDFKNYSDKTLLSKLFVKENHINILPKFYDGDCFFIAGFKKGNSFE